MLCRAGSWAAVKWRRSSAPEEPAPEETGITLSDETRRALAAARSAADELARVRAATPQVVRTASALEDLNAHNGFYLLIRQAWES